MGTQITRVQDVPKSADTPYHNVLVVGLFSTYNVRKRLEKDIVKQLADLGTDAVASTSMMKTTTPMTPETYVAMIDEIDADALLVTQLVDIKSKTSMKDMNPEATYKVRPSSYYSYYYNVWDVRLTEYIEPQLIEVKSTLVLSTQVYSVSSQDLVWAIESKSEIVQEGDPGRNYMLFVDEAEIIVKQLVKNGLVAR